MPYSINKVTVSLANGDQGGPEQQEAMWSWGLLGLLWRWKICGHHQVSEQKAKWGPVKESEARVWNKEFRNGSGNGEEAEEGESRLLDCH